MYVGEAKLHIETVQTQASWQKIHHSQGLLPPTGFA